MRINRYLILSTLFLLAAAQTLAAGDWQKWTDCELVEDEYRDGDSFYVRRGPRSEYIVRLYFVDCPESDDRFPDRVDAQAKYFGIDHDDALKCGEKATQFTLKALDDGFTVHTRKEKSYSSSSKPRYYGFVELDDGVFLAEELVRNGLARIYGKPSDRPDGEDKSDLYRKFKKLKKAAVDHKRGAWKYNPDIKKAPEVALMESSLEKGQTLLTDKTVPVYSLEKPHKFRGLLKSGAKLTLHETLEDQYVVVTFKSNGKTIKAACRRWDLK